MPVFSAPAPGRIGHLTRSLAKDDLVVAISFRRGLAQTVEGARKACQREAHCVAITDTYLSPLARIANETFLASIETTSFGASYAPPVALGNEFLPACEQVRGAETKNIGRQISEEQLYS